LCTPDSPLFFNGFCSNLEVRRNADGSYTGTFYGEPSTVDRGGSTPIVGPFAAVTDPSKGYPTELTPDQYWRARSFVAGVRYQLFDGAIDGQTLTFWLSQLDVWTDWCALQTPSVWTVGGRHEYRCVPQGADAGTTDMGKLALCTSNMDSPICTDRLGVPGPCACIDSSGFARVDLPLCSQAYCECSRSGCHADVRGGTMTGSLTFDGTKLVGTMSFGGGGQATITLGRVTP
jgi:hypothetical protein